MSLISLDYDGTYTDDPELWDQFVKIAKSRGHQVYCITMRYPQEGKRVEETIGKYVDKIIYTGRQAKRDFLLAQGIVPNIWIDDNPHFIFMGAQR